MAAKKAKAVSEETTEADDRTRFQKVLASETIAAIQKKHGSTVLYRAADDRYQEVPRIPTDILALDWALGGGWPAGRINIIFGHKSSSKTTTLLRTIGNAQKLCAACFSPAEEGGCKCGSYREMVCAFIDVEGTFDGKWAQAAGIDLEQLLLIRPEYAEQALDIAEALIRSGDVDVLVVDSIAFLTPSKEIEESVEKDMMGVQARLIGKSIRKLNAALSTIKNEQGRLPTIFFTNQIRMKLGVMFGNPETTPGGNAPGFAASTEVKVWPGKYEIDESTGVPIHVDMNFRVEKNKSGPAKMEGQFRIMLTETPTKKEGAIYEEDTIVSLGQKFGLISGSGNSWTCMDEKFNGKSVIEKKLLEDPDFKKRVKASLMKILLSA